MGYIGRRKKKHGETRADRCECLNTKNPDRPGQGEKQEAKLDSVFIQLLFQLIDFVPDPSCVFKALFFYRFLQLAVQFL